MRNPDIILGPVITEKSMSGNQESVYTFKVDKKATRSYYINQYQTIMDSFSDYELNQVNKDIVKALGNLDPNRSSITVSLLYGNRFTESPISSDEAKANISLGIKGENSQQKACECQGMRK